MKTVRPGAFAVVLLVGAGVCSGGVPVQTEDLKLTRSAPNEDDTFGERLAISGSTVVVGAKFADHSGVSEAGAAYIFDLTTGEQVSELTASDAARRDWFGSAVAVDGTNALIGARFNNHSGLIAAGAVYVFDLTTGMEVDKLVASDAESGDAFGSAIAVSGRTALVRASFDDHSGSTDAGSAYVFDLRTRSEVKKLTRDEPGDDDQLGGAVAISGRSALIAVNAHDHSGFEDAGAVFVFDLMTGDEVAKLTSPEPIVGEYWGSSVAISGTTAIVGARLHDHSGLENAGAAYVFDLAADRFVAKFTAPDASEADFFGWSVAISGRLAVITAYQGDHGGVSNSGVAYVFDLATGRQVSKLVASDAAARDRFGFSVAIDGTTAVLSATGDDHGGVPDAGSVYVFRLDPPCAADLAEPAGVLDFADVGALADALVRRSSIADVNFDGVSDLGDIVAFVGSFTAGCP